MWPGHPLSALANNWTRGEASRHITQQNKVTLTYKTLAIRQPGYLLNLLNTYQPVRSLRSQDNHLLAKPSVYTSIGRRTFSNAAPQIWTAIIPQNIRILPSAMVIKRNLNTFYFAAAF